MNAALATFSATSETKWTIISGPMQGTVRLINLPVFTIGRSPECELVIVNDPKCSRRHVTVYCNKDGCSVEGQSEGNSLLLNGHAIQRASLSENDVLTIGLTEVRFNTTSVASHPERKSLARPRRTSRQAPKSNPRMMVIYVIVALIALFLFALPSQKKRAELALRTEQQIQADIEAANKLNDAAKRFNDHRLDKGLTARQAQENFVRGFRDYRKGQFERSLDSFQACLALDPNHILCNRYIRLAQRRFSELVQSNIVLGRKYRDQNQFQACRSAFRNVMVMVKDPTTVTYKEAKANYDACNSLIEDRF